jgi:murein L,D-transpeptidase YcbB/YkuD
MTLRVLSSGRSVACCFLLWLLSVSAGPAEGQEAAGEVTTLLRGRLEAVRANARASAGGVLLLSRTALPRFYEARGFEPAWLGPDLDDQLHALEAAIRRAAAHGLEPADYHLDELLGLRTLVLSGQASSMEMVDLEVLASDAFMVLGSHLLNGRVNPETIDPEWLANRRNAFMDEVLAEALASDRIEGTLLELAPMQPRYRSMLDAAQALRRVAADGGWPVVADGPRLELGVTDPRVAVLRDRLSASGDLAVGVAPEPEVFGEDVADAVQRFQARHGLDVDGVVGPASLAALNVPAEERVRQLEVNMERWRWLPADLGARHIEVNIAGFDVKVVENGRTALRHRAIVGREYRQTPMFSGTMTYLVLAPYWHVPPNIAAADKLPAIKADPGILAAQRFTVLDLGTNEPVDPATVDWQALTGAELNRRYRLRQDPGPYNALGNVKFMFPNQHNVYLHDTPSRELFSRTARSFSSGCIRIENPLDLAEYLLADQEGWSRARIQEVIAGGVERTVRLTRGLPVHLLYWTAWAEEDGTLHFRNDLYGRDQRVWQALRASPPGQ